MTPQEKTQLDLSVADEASLPRLFEGTEKRHFLDHFIILARRKSFILLFTLAVAVLTALISLLMSTYYQATVKMLPPQQGSSLSGLAGQLGDLAPLLGAAGGKDLLKNPGDLYVAMLRSRTLADRLIDSFSLMSRYKAKLHDDARKHLTSLSEITAGKDGVISVAVEDTDPKIAADIANAYISELEKLTKTLAVTDASKRRIFFEREAKVASEQLKTAEQDFKKMQETTGIIQIDSQSRVMFQAYADLKAALTEKEIEIESISSFASSDNPDLVRARRERDALRAQISSVEKGQGGPPVGDLALEKVPEKALKYYDNFREVGYRNALLQLMLKQYESARVDEAKDFALIQVLDPALPPERKSRPHRAIICLIYTLLGFLVASFWVYLSESLQHAKEDPQYLTRLQLLKFYLFRRGKEKAATR
jgi:tyrosine-protein kinase Etk/Wzc